MIIVALMFFFAAMVAPFLIHFPEHGSLWEAYVPEVATGDGERPLRPLTRSMRVFHLAAPHVGIRSLLLRQKYFEACHFQSLNGPRRPPNEQNNAVGPHAAPAGGKRTCVCRHQC